MYDQCFTCLNVGVGIFILFNTCSLATRWDCSSPGGVCALWVLLFHMLSLFYFLFIWWNFSAFHFFIIADFLPYLATQPLWLQCVIKFSSFLIIAVMVECCPVVGCTKKRDTKSALGRAHLPPTTVFRRLKTTRCCFDGPPIPVRAWDFFDVIKFHVAALQCIRYGRKESGSGIRTMIRIQRKS